MRRGVVTHRVAPSLLVDRRVRTRAQPQHTVDDLRAHHDHAGRRGLRVRDHGTTFIRGDRSTVADLAASLRIERSAVEDDLDILTFVSGFDARPAQNERGDRPVGLQLVVTGEFATDLLVLAETRVELTEAHRVLGEFGGRAAAAALAFEELAEAALVNGESRRGRDLLRHLEREAVGVGEAERRVRVDPPLTLRRRARDGLVDHRETLRERALELLLFLDDDLRDAIARRGELVVMPLHRLHNLAAELRERPGLEAKAASVHGGATDQATKD